MATLYYNNAIADNDWANLSNWWTDPSCSAGYEALSLPSSSDDVVVTGDCLLNSGGTTPTIHSLTINSCNFSIPVVVGDSMTNDGSLVLNGTAEIGTYSLAPYYTFLYGTLTLNDYSKSGVTYGGIIYIYGGGSLNYRSFIGSSSYFYPVYCTLSFNDESMNYGYAGYTGGGATNVTFNDSSINIGNDGGLKGTFGDTIFYDNSINVGAVTGATVVFNQNSTSTDSYTDYTGGPYTGFTPAITASTVTFNNSSSNGIGSTISGDSIFNNNAYNIGSVGNATFNDDSSNYNPSNVAQWGTYSGTITCNTTSPCPYPPFYFGVYGGSGSFDEDWSNPTNWFTDSTYLIQAPRIPTTTDHALIGSGFNCTNNSGSYPTVDILTVENGTFSVTCTANTVNVNNGSIINISDFTLGQTYWTDVVFSNTSSLSCFIYAGDVLFKDYSNITTYGMIGGYCLGYPNWSDCSVTFQDGAANNGFVYHYSIFNGSSSNNSGGWLYGNATFNDNTLNYGHLEDWNYDGSYTSTMTFNSNSINYGMVVFDDLSNSLIVFNDFSRNDSSSVYGSSVFYDYAYNTGNYGSYTGLTVTFNENSHNEGDIGSVCTFNNNSYHSYNFLGGVHGSGSTFITGDVTFNDDSYVTYGYINSYNVTFNHYSHTNFTIYDPGSALVQFKDNSYSTGMIYPFVQFSNNSYILGSISGGMYYGNVMGNAEFYDDSFCTAPTYGTVLWDGLTGSNTYGSFINGQFQRSLYFDARVDSDWNNLSNWWNDSGFTSPVSSLPTNVDNIFIKADCDTNSGGSISVYSLYVGDPSTPGIGLYNITVDVTTPATFEQNYDNNATINGSVNLLYAGHAGTINGNVNLSGDSVLQPTSIVNGDVFAYVGFASGTINGDAFFFGNTYHIGTINGNATFNDNSSNYDPSDLDPVGTITGTVTCNTTATYCPYPPYILYFNAAVDNDWNTLGNWWKNVDCTVPAPSLPISTDNVVLKAICSSNGGSTPTINNIDTFIGGPTQIRLDIEIIVLGTATFNEDSTLGGYNLPLLTGNAVFNDSSQNLGTVKGNATFNDYSENLNYVNGAGVSPPPVAIFNDESKNSSNINCDTIFNNNSINGDYNNGYITANVTFNNTSHNRSPLSTSLSIIFNNNSYNAGYLEIVASFYDDSFNVGTVITDVSPGTFFDGLTGSATNFYVSAAGWFLKSYGEFVNGRQVFYFNGNSGMTTNWADFQAWWSDPAYTVSGNIPKLYNEAIVNANITYNNDPIYHPSNVYNITINNATISIPLTITKDCVLNNGSNLSESVIAQKCILNSGSGLNSTCSINVSESCEFYNDSYNSSLSIIGSIIFHDSSYNLGVIDSANFYDASYVGNGGSVTTANFYNSSHNSGSVTTGIFNDSSVNNNGSCSNATFYDTSYNHGTCSDAVFYDSSYNDRNIYTMGGTSTIIFNNNSYNAVDGNCDGNIVFNNTAYNLGIASGPSVNFNNYSYNDGTSGGYVNFNDSSFNAGDISGGSTVNYNGFTGINSYGRFTLGEPNPNQSVTFYFNNLNTMNYLWDWNDTTNWWIDESCTIQAPSIPTSVDNAIILDDCLNNSGSSPVTINNLTVNGNNTFAGFTIKVNGIAIFNDTSRVGDNSYPGTDIYGPIKFYDYSYNNYDCPGTDDMGSGVQIEFYDNSYNNKIVCGDITTPTKFYNFSNSVDTAYVYFGEFYNSTYNNGDINGATFYNNSYNGTTGYIECSSGGNATFNDTSYNDGEIGGGGGLVTFNDSSYNNSSGTIQNSATFNDTSYNSGSVYQTTYNHRSYAVNAKAIHKFGDALANVVTINDDPITGYSADGVWYNGSLVGSGYSFTRVTPWPIGKGVNGSSILGIV